MNAEAIRNEAGNVSRNDDPLAEQPLAEGPDGSDDFGRGPLGRYDLEEMEIARRVEEVGSEKPATKRLGSRFDQCADRYRRRVRRDDRGGVDDPLELLEQLAFRR